MRPRFTRRDLLWVVLAVIALSVVVWAQQFPEYWTWVKWPEQLIMQSMRPARAVE